MTIDAALFSEQVIKPTLEYLQMYSRAAEKLLLGTAAQESNLDPFYQHNQGIGLFQISADQHRHIWDTYLAFLPDLASMVRGLASQRLFLINPDQELKTNLAYSTAIAWVIYLQSECQLPEPEDIDGLCQCWAVNFCRLRSNSQQKYQQFTQQIRACEAAA